MVVHEVVIVSLSYKHWSTGTVKGLPEFVLDY